MAHLLSEQTKTTLQRQYGHFGRLQAVSHSDPDIMDCIKFLLDVKG